MLADSRPSIAPPAASRILARINAQSPSFTSSLSLFTKWLVGRQPVVGGLGIGIAGALQ